jgi:hypothetical protein
MLAAATGFAQMIDHGAPAQVSECRGAIAALDGEGKPIVLALAVDMFEGRARTSLLVIDATTGQTTQHWHPKRQASNDNSYHLMLTKAGRFYATIGSMLLEFDPDRREWLSAQTIEGGTAMSFAEGPDGMVYAGLYPSCDLMRFDPLTKKVETLVDLDATQKYPSFLQVGADGWVYAGIGTAKNNLVAFNPGTKELRQLADEASRGVGSGYVVRGADGGIYGRPSANDPWMRLEAGEGVTIESSPARAASKAISWQRTAPEFGNGWTFDSFNLPGRRMVIDDGSGAKREVTFDYESQGALITTLVRGPNNTLHGSTAHPMHWFTVRDAKVNDLGHVVPIGGGNICGFANVGETMYGAAYGGGVLYAFDMNKPFNGATGDEPNPRQLIKFPAVIGRPRALLRHGDNVIMAGYPGYGRAGGGLAFYNTTTDEHQLLEHEDVIPGHATVTLRALDDTTLVGGTSIHTPGGATAVASEALLYLFDTETMRVTFSITPAPGHPSIAAVEVDADGRVFGVTEKSTLFIFDPQSKQMIAQHDLSQHGRPVRPDQSLLRDEAGRIIVLLSGAVLAVAPGSTQPTLLATLPVEAHAGSAIIDGRLYFASGSHLYSVKLGD